MNFNFWTKADAPKKAFILAALIAVVFKFSALAFVTVTAPDKLLEPDSVPYLMYAENLEQYGVFARDVDSKGVPTFYNIFRTPGYPVFLAFFHFFLKIPFSGIVVLHFALNILTAWIVSLIAKEIDPRLCYLSALIILLDPTITVFSMMIMTEAVFLFITSTVVLCVLKYWRTRSAAWLYGGAFLLVASIYVRPVSMYLGVAIVLLMAVFFIKEKYYRGVIHLIIFAMIVHGCVGMWQYRNLKKRGEFAFSTIDNATYKMYGLIHSYVQNKNPDLKDLSPVPYYLTVVSDSLRDMLLDPGSFKYFESEGLKHVGKVFSYPFLVFWVFGFGIAFLRLPLNFHYCFLVLGVIYFIGVPIVATSYMVVPRFRVPAMPFIAILSAYGWSQFWAWYGLKKKKLSNDV